MKAIWKFPLEPDAKIDMPIGAKVLKVDTQDGQPFLWALVDSEADTEVREFSTLGTGHDAGRVSHHNYVGSFQLLGGVLVFHVFETP